MKLEVGNKLKTVFAKTKLGFKKHSAEILIAGGVTGVVVSAVLACVATTKVGKHVNDAKEKIKVSSRSSSHRSSTRRPRSPAGEAALCCRGTRRELPPPPAPSARCRSPPSMSSP